MGKCTGIIRKITAYMLVISVLVFYCFSNNILRNVISVKAAEETEIILNGNDKGVNSMIGSYSASTNDYQYLGYATFKGATEDYRYLQITYTGNISKLRFEFNRIIDETTDEQKLDGPYWFNPSGQNQYFITRDRKDIPLNGNNTTIIIDLKASGIDMGYYNSGIHMHCDDIQKNGVITISDARLLRDDTPQGIEKDHVYFGNYIQDRVIKKEEIDYLDGVTFTDGQCFEQGIHFAKKDNKYYKDAPIEWRILEDKDGYYTLISEKVLDQRNFDGWQEFWSTSNIRSWLNNEFLDLSFSKNEQDDIAISTVTNLESDYENNPNGGKPYDVITEDKVYLLSYYDFVDNSLGFLEQSSRIAYATAYVNNLESATRYWLRGPKMWSYGLKQAYYVDANGSTGTWYPTYSYGIRPVIRVKKDSKYLSKTKPDEDLLNTNPNYTRAFETVLNYKGYCYAYSPVVDNKGKIVPNTKVKYTYLEDSSITKETTSDENGYAVFETPMLILDQKNLINGIDLREIHFVPVSGESNVKFKDISLQVKITPLQFTQNWKGIAGADAYASLGAGVGASAGVAKIDADIVSASAGGGMQYGIDVSLNHQGDKLELIMNSVYNEKLAAKLNSGIDASFFGKDAKLFNAGGNATATGTVSRGIEISDLNKMSGKDKEKLGKYMLSTMLNGCSSNVEVKKIIDFLIDSTDTYTQGIKVSVGADTSAAKLEIPTNKESINLGNIGAGYSISLSNGIDKINGEKSITSDINLENKISLFSTPFIKTNILGSGISGSLSLKYVSDLNDKYKKLEFSKIEEDSASVIANKSVTNSRTYTILEENKKKLIQTSSGNKLNQFIKNGSLPWSLNELVTLSNDMESLSTGIPIKDETGHFKKFEFSLPLELRDIVGVEISANISGVETTKYQTATGMYVPGKDTIYDSEPQIEDEVNDSTIDVFDIISKEVDNTIESVKNMYNTITGYVSNALEYGATKITATSDAVKKWTVSIIGAKNNSGPKASYSIRSFSSKKRALSNSNASDMAVTVGEPYTILVKDENGKTLESFDNNKLNLQLGFTLEDLEMAGVSYEQIDNMSIYYYDNETNAYIYEGGNVDKEKMLVDVDISKAGQYVLAIDTKEPVIENIVLSDKSVQPTITADIGELSSISKFSFKIDEQEYITEENINHYYNSVSGMFSYKVEQALTNGSHKVSFYAEDSSGNKMKEAVTLEFEVDSIAPQISNISLEETEGIYNINAMIDDDSTAISYAVIDVVKNGEKYSKTIEIQNNNGTIGGSYILEKGETVENVALIVVDEAGNKAVSQLFNNNETQKETTTTKHNAETTVRGNRETITQKEKVTLTKGKSNVKNLSGTKLKKLQRAKKSLKVSWKKINGVSGYQIQYSTSSKFKKSKKITIKKARTTSKTIKKLKAKKKYYVRIRTYITVNGKKKYSRWSKKKSKKTK